MIPNNINERDFKYKNPTIKSFKEFEKYFVATYNKFSKDLELTGYPVTFNRTLIYNIRKRLDQRHDYYKYFHSDEKKTTHISQTKEVALICYWVIKYKPINHDNVISERYCHKYDCTINEMFALFLIESFLYDIYKDKEKVVNFFNTENKRIILYNFMHRDMSKEAFILYVSSLIGALEL